MSETQQQAEAIENEATDEPQGEEETTDWKAEARKWEKYAKQNKDAAEELEKIKTERMSETEKMLARAEKAEAELSRISAENERVQAAQEVSKATEVPLELLMFCADKDHMEQFAKLYVSSAHVPAAPKKQSSRVIRDNETPTSTRDVFAEMVSNIL